MNILQTIRRWKHRRNLARLAAQTAREVADRAANAPKPVTVNVTQKHIDAGTRGCAFDCPVALAIRKALNIRDDVIVGIHGSLYFRGNVYFYPPEVGEFIKAFDSKKPVQPFSFEILV